MPSEFDISGYVCPGNNSVTVCNLKWCDGSYLECQDKWRLSGIFRDVYLMSRPRKYIEDVHVRYEWGDGLQEAFLHVEGTLRDCGSGGDSSVIRAKLMWQNKEIFREETVTAGQRFVFEMTVSSPALWSYETPELYDLFISVNDKNFPCVIFWPLGNESGFGCNHQAMSRYIKEVDPSRPVHYLHALEDFCVDVISRMYSDFDFVEEQAHMEEPRPFLLNEYGHSMGNSMGSLNRYIELFDTHKRLIGGFIWEFCEQGIRMRAGI